MNFGLMEYALENEIVSGEVCDGLMFLVRITPMCCEEKD